MIRYIVMCAIVMMSFTALGGEGNTYSRSQFGSGWIDEDRDCQDARAEILILYAYQYSGECTIENGFWVGEYTGHGFTNPSDMDIDHIVPLQEAWNSGASKWTREKRIRFANDLDNLIPVSASANRSKGARDPSEWMPPNLTSWGGYLQQWVKIKTKYDLYIDDNEYEAIIKLGKIADNFNKRFKVTKHNIAVMGSLED